MATARQHAAVLQGTDPGLVTVGFGPCRGLTGRRDGADDRLATPGGLCVGAVRGTVRAGVMAGGRVAGGCRVCVLAMAAVVAGGRRGGLRALVVRCPVRGGVGVRGRRDRVGVAGLLVRAGQCRQQHRGEHKHAPPCDATSGAGPPASGGQYTVPRNCRSPALNSVGSSANSAWPASAKTVTRAPGRRARSSSPCARQRGVMAYHVGTFTS